MMKKITTLLLLLLLSAQSLSAKDALSVHQKNTDALYRQGAGAEDGGYTAISTSMFGWGIGLAAGIAIVAAVMHQSKSGGAHSQRVTCD